jgi:DNA excision repair protein ERCC-6
MIRDYIVSHGGSVYTQMLIDHFNRLCTTPQRSAEFKEILKQIAVLEKGGRNGRGKWSLKPEYAKRKV